MPDNADRNEAIFNTVIQGAAVSQVAEQAGITPTTVRRIFLRECLRRSPEGYTAGVHASNGGEPSIAWIKANAERFKSEGRLIQQEEIETLRVIRWLEARGYSVTGERPFSRSTPLSEFADLTPRQREYLARKGVLTLADAAKLKGSELEKVADSSRQVEIIKQLLELTR